MQNFANFPNFANPNPLTQPHGACRTRMDSSAQRGAQAPHVVAHASAPRMLVGVLSEIDSEYKEHNISQHNICIKY